MIYINGKEYEYESGKKISEYVNAPYAVCALVNNDVCPLDAVAVNGQTIQLLDVNSRGGFFCYRQSLILMFLTALHSVFGKVKCTVRHSIGKTTYCETELTPELKIGADKKILAYMRRLHKAAMPIEKIKI